MAGDNHFIRQDNDLPKIEHAWIEQESKPIIDLLRNISGLNDDCLYVSMHTVLVQAVREWRDEARKILEAS
jgi:hypothetical protein